MLLSLPLCMFDIIHNETSFLFKSLVPKAARGPTTGLGPTSVREPTSDHGPFGHPELNQT